MSTAFADLEERAASACASMLANATLTAGALSVDGILDIARDEAAGGYMQGRRVQFIAPSSAAVSALAEDGAVTVTSAGESVGYLLAMPPTVSGGMTILDLKRAAL